MSKRKDQIENDMLDRTEPLKPTVLPADPLPPPLKRGRGPTLPRPPQGAVKYLPDHVFEVPVTRNHFCKLCKLQNVDADLYIWVNRSLCDCTPYRKIIARLEEHGLHFSPSMLSRHYKEHVLDHVTNQAFYYYEFMDAVRAVGGDMGENVGVVMSRMIIMFVFQALNQFRPEVLATLPPMDLLALGMKAADLSSRVENADAAMRLKEFDLDQKVKATQALFEAHLAAAIDQLAAEAEGDPEWPKMRAFLERVAGKVTTATRQLTDGNPSPDGRPRPHGRGAGGEGHG